MDPTYILRVWMYGSYIYPESMNEWILPISWEYVCEDPSERQRTGSDPEYLIELIDTDVLGVVCLNKKNRILMTYCDHKSLFSKEMWFYDF